ncbi:MAG: hypothetical protein ACRYF0_00245 [Janthinobacterium lividum]
MKKTLAFLFLASTFSFTSMANDVTIAKKIVYLDKKPTTRINEYMCGDFVICGQNATICGNTPEQRTAIFEYAVKQLCQPGVVV